MSSMENTPLVRAHRGEDGRGSKGSTGAGDEQDPP